MAVLVCIHGSKWDRVVQMWAMMAGPSASSFSPKRCSMMAHICSTLSPFNCVTPCPWKHNNHQLGGNVVEGKQCVSSLPR